MSLPDLRPQATRRSANELVTHLKSFELDLKFSAGIWFFSPPASRVPARYAAVVDLRAARDRFAEGLAEAMDAVPGVRIAEEPKPYEPRGHILYGTTYEGLLLGMKVEALLKNAENRRLIGEGHALVAMNPEMGH